MVVISAGICPRDELARDCGLEVGPRGGVVVDDCLRTSDPDIFAIGEVALHRGMIYGLVAPGYEMADVVAANLTGAEPRFHRLRHVDQAQADGRRRRQFRRHLGRGRRRPSPHVRRPVRRGLQEAGVQRRRHPAWSAAFSSATPRNTATSLGLFKSGEPLHVAARRAVGRPGAERPRPAAGGDAQVCSCNSVSEAPDPRRRPRQGAHHGRPGQDVHQGRHRLRRLPASGHRPAQGRTRGDGQESRQSPLRALRLTAARSCSRSSRSSG